MTEEERLGDCWSPGKSPLRPATPHGQGTLSRVSRTRRGSAKPDCRLRSMEWINQPTTQLRGYTLRRQIGRGGFGQVWEAVDPAGTAVALKFVPLSGRTEPVIDIDHPHVLRTLETWEADDFQVLALELADKSLLDRLHEAQQQGLRGVAREELIGYFRQAADALDALHAKGYQHRDIKPHNLLLIQWNAESGRLWARPVLENSVTGHTGTMTAAYAAPRIFRRENHPIQRSVQPCYYLLPAQEWKTSFFGDRSDGDGRTPSGKTRFDHADSRRATGCRQGFVEATGGPLALVPRFVEASAKTDGGAALFPRYWVLVQRVSSWFIWSFLPAALARHRRLFQANPRRRRRRSQLQPHQKFQQLPLYLTAAAGS